MAKTIDEQAQELVKKISDAAIELAFTRHSLTTTDYEETDYPDIEEGVEAFKELVEEVKADVLAVLTGDDTGCLDPEDIDYDNEAEFTKRALLTVAREAEAKGANESYQAGMRHAAQICRNEFNRSPEASLNHDSSYMSGYEDACDHLSIAIEQASVISCTQVNSLDEGKAG